MLRALFLSILGLLLPFTAFCGVYGYIDPEGIYHITNIRPANKGYHILVRDAVKELALKGGNYKPV